MASGGASSSSSKPQRTPEQILALYNQSLPETLATTVGQTPNVANTLALSAVGANPIYTAGDLAQLQQLGGGFTQAGINIARQQAGGTADLLANEGARTAVNASLLDRLINPEYYQSRGSIATGANSLLAPYANGARLTPGELAAVERSVNQSNQATGNLGNPNALNTVANAMNFGQAAREKEGMFNQALQTAAGVNQALANTSFNTTQTALGAGNVSNNFGLTQFNPSQAVPNINVPTQFGSNIFSSLASLGGSGKGSSDSAQGSIGGCYITTAVCEYAGLPDDCEELQILRKYRDEWLSQQQGGPELIAEYKQIGPKIVAKLQENPSVLIFGEILETIRICISLIKNGFYGEARDRYVTMTRNLQEMTETN